MKVFDVEISGLVSIEADSKEEAIEMVKQMLGRIFRSSSKRSRSNSDVP